MKKFILTLMAIFSFNSQATLITLELDKAQYQENDLITLNLIASNFAYPLGGFAAEVAFEHNQLELMSWQFGNGFDDGLGSYQYADNSIDGLLYIDNYADIFADENVIIANQGVEFILASIVLKASVAGEHIINLLGNAQVISFDNFNIETLNGANITASVNKVPEPLSALILLTGLALLYRRA